MTIEIIQTCNKCKSERKLDIAPGAGGMVIGNPQIRGWRQIENRDICADCMRAFLTSAP